MRTAICSLESLTPYSQSRHYDVPKLNKESPKDYEARTWRERMHANKDGNVFIPPMAFKNCITNAAEFLSMKVGGGKGQATYTKHFLAGILVVDPLVLPDKKDEVPGEWLFLPSDGKRGGGKRVDKCMPYIASWSGDVTFHILDETITQDVFEQHLRESGQFIGVGRFRPRNGGFYGRFKVNKVKWAA